MTGADQPADFDAGRVKQPPHLPISAFGQRNVVPAVDAFAAAVLNAQKIRHPVLERDAVQYLLPGRFGKFANHSCCIRALHLVTRMCEAIRSSPELVNSSRPSVLKSSRPMKSHLPVFNGGSASNTDGRCCGSAWLTISPLGLWYSRMRGRQGAFLRGSSFPLMRT